MIRRARGCPLLVAVVVLLLAAPAGWAFNLDTHRDLTRAAFSWSSVPAFLRSLGIDPDKPLSGGLLRGSHPPVDWLVQGVRDEDDPFRFLHHFYDPVNNRGLDATGPLGVAVRGERAPDWALEDRGDFSTQDFSYRDAREAFRSAFAAAAPTDREAALARTFETLGHVIHLVQDMASPPHTRNDMHGGFGFGASSLYERHLEQPQARAPFLFGSPVRFDLPRHYWTTGDGRGLAEFVNRNFVWEGTNFRARVDGAIGGGYPSPVLRLGVDEQGQPFEATLDIQAQLEPGLRDRNDNLIEGSVTFFANNFLDPDSGLPLRNERMTTFSLFDRELQRRGESLVFTLNRYTIEAQAAFLIPRAVGYSAGLLDYFFRGTLDFEVKLGATDPTQRELRITNTSTEDMGGDFTLYAEDEDGNRSLVATFALSLPAAAGSEPLIFTPPPGVRAYALVFQGTLGAEEGAVAGAVNPWELPYIFLVQEVAELTGDEVRTEVVWEDSPTRFSASSFLTKRPGKQRAAGRFVFPGETLPGRYLQAVSVSSRPEVRLRLNGMDVGSSWSLATGPILVPVTWEVQVDSPDDNLAKLPRDMLLVMLDGTAWRTPLIWWRSGRTEAGAEGSFQADCGGDPRECWERTSTDTTVGVGVFFGDGDQNGFERNTGPLDGNYPLSVEQTSVSFTPTLGVEGFPVGTALFLFSDTFDRPPFFCGAGSITNDFINIFAGIYTTQTGEKVPVWVKNTAAVQHIQTNAVRKAFGTCSKPQVPPPSAPSLPELRFRRDYSPSEQEVFQRFNITPPQYEIRLR